MSKLKVDTISNTAETVGPTFPDGIVINGPISGTGAAIIGIGQTWQDVTGSRSANTSYQNTTGKPIMVSISGNTTGTYLQASVNNSTWITIAGVLANTAQQVIGIIPDNHYYRAHTSTSTITNWAELR